MIRAQSTRKKIRSTNDGFGADMETNRPTDADGRRYTAQKAREARELLTVGTAAPTNEKSIEWKSMRHRINAWADAGRIKVSDL